MNQILIFIMPSSFEKKVAAGVILTTSILLAEYLNYSNQQEHFELSSLHDPRALPLWLLENSITYLGHSLPPYIAMSLKVLLPLMSLGIILQLDEAEEEHNPERLLGANQHILFNANPREFNSFIGEPHRMNELR